MYPILCLQLYVFSAPSFSAARCAASILRVRCFGYIWPDLLAPCVSLVVTILLPLWKHSADTFRSAAIKRSVDSDELAVTPDFPVDVRDLDVLSLRYVVNFALGRCTPHRGWVRSEWVFDTSEVWQRKVALFMDQVELWQQKVSVDGGAWFSPGLNRFYLDIVSTSVQRERRRKRREDLQRRAEEHRQALALCLSRQRQRMQRSFAFRSKPALRKAGAAGGGGSAGGLVERRKSEPSLVTGGAAGVCQMATRGMRRVSFSVVETLGVRLPSLRSLPAGRRTCRTASLGPGVSLRRGQAGSASGVGCLQVHEAPLDVSVVGPLEDV